MALRQIEHYVNGVLSSTETVTVADSDANTDALNAKIRAALTTNATFLALPAPTNAQVLAQVQALTRQANALIRLLANAVDSTAGT